MAYGEVLWYNKYDGWELANDKLVAILKNTQITPWGISAITNTPITPTWVITALQSYEDAGGYAGMSPAEYLDRMSGEREQRPKHTF